MPTPLMTTTDAASALGVSVRTLQDWRYKRIGPRFVRQGRVVRYSQTALDSWVAGNEVGNG